MPWNRVFRASAVLLGWLVLTTSPIHAQDRPITLRGTSPDPVSAPLITISFDDTPVGGVVAAFARFADFSFVLGSGAAGEISADVRDVPWNVALDAILHAHGMRIVESESGIYVVESLDWVRDRIEYVEPETRVFKIRYQRAESLRAALASMLTDRGAISVAPETNAIVVTDVPEILDRIERMLWG